MKQIGWAIGLEGEKPQKICKKDELLEAAIRDYVMTAAMGNSTPPRIAIYEVFEKDGETHISSTPKFMDEL